MSGGFRRTELAAHASTIGNFSKRQMAQAWNELMLLTSGDAPLLPEGIIRIKRTSEIQRKQRRARPDFET